MRLEANTDKDNIKESDTGNEKDVTTTDAINESEMDDTKEKPVDKITNKKDEAKVRTEDNLEIRKMRLGERIRAKKAKLQENMEGMTTAQKIGYILYYYKGTIIWSILIIFAAIAIPITIYNKTRPVAISYAVLNCYEDENINTELFEEYKDYYGFNESDQIQVSKSVFLNIENYNVNTIHNYSQSDYSQFPMLCHNDYFDVVFTDDVGLEFCTKEAVVQPLESRLSPDVYNIIKEEYGELIVKSPNYNGDMVEYAIDISDTEFGKNLGTSYDTIYICFPGTSERNFTNSKKMLDFIFDLGLEF